MDAQIKAECLSVKMMDLTTVAGLVLARVPTLAREVVEHYPSRRDFHTGTEKLGELFSVDFFDDNGRNVATWLPMVGSLLMQPGSDGRGREWGLPKTHTRDLVMTFVREVRDRQETASWP